MPEKPNTTSYHGDGPHVDPWILSNARELRGHETMPERLLWNCIRGRKIAGLKFRRQHSRDRDVYDFYCHEARLVVELDGRSHEDNRQGDRARDELAASQGLLVLRFRNKAATDQLERVIRAIEREGVRRRDALGGKPSPPA